MNFAHPWFLLLLPLLPLLAVLWFFLNTRANRRLAQIILPELREKLLPRRQRFLFLTQLLLLTPGLLLLTLAAARPQWGYRDETITSRSRNLLIAVDVSRSMLAQDVHPNRLGRAKADILDLIPALQGDRAALLAFRYKAVLLCPLTTDATFLRQSLDTLSPDVAAPGPTDLATAITASLEALDPVQDEYNAILLISDGEELTGSALDAARLAAKRNIPIFTVGIGDPKGTTIPDKSGSLQFDGAPVRTALNEHSLRAIATASGGTYIPLATAGTAHTTLGAIYNKHLRPRATRDQQETRERQIQERYPLFLIPALLLLLAAASLSRGRLASPRRKTIPSPLLAICTFYILHSTFAFASTNLTGVAAAREAQSLLKKNQPQAAAEAFEQASRTTTLDRSPPYAFNAALAYLKAQKLGDALRLLGPLADDRTLELSSRANDLIAKITLAQSGASTNSTEKLTALTTAANRLQNALREAPNSVREKNFARVAPLLPKAREDAHLDALIARYKDTSPPQLLGQILSTQRKLLRTASSTFTNAPAALIPAAESLARQQRDNADLWIPLKPILLQPLTNDTERAEFETLINQARSTMITAATRLDNLDAAAIEPVTLAETLPYRLWFLTAEPPALIDEDLLLQTNTLASADVPLFPTRPDQPEALRLTRHFRETFPQWADQYQQRAQADTNAAPFTADDRAQIETLAAQTEDLQSQATLKSNPDRPALQTQAHQNLLRIKELLPKDKNQQQQNPQQNQDQQQQQQDQPQKQDQQQDQQQDQEQQDPQQDQPEPKEPSEPQTPEKIKEMLRRALEREKEHEAEKRRQLQSIPLPPTEKDW